MMYSRYKREIHHETWLPETFLFNTVSLSQDKILTNPVPIYTRSPVWPAKPCRARTKCIPSILGLTVKLGCHEGHAGLGQRTLGLTVELGGHEGHAGLGHGLGEDLALDVHSTEGDLREQWVYTLHWRLHWYMQIYIEIGNESNALNIISTFWTQFVSVLVSYKGHKTWNFKLQHHSLNFGFKP